MKKKYYVILLMVITFGILSMFDGCSVTEYVKNIGLEEESIDAYWSKEVIYSCKNDIAILAEVSIHNPKKSFMSGRIYYSYLVIPQKAMDEYIKESIAKTKEQSKIQKNTEDKTLKIKVTIYKNSCSDGYVFPDPFSDIYSDISIDKPFLNDNISQTLYEDSLRLKNDKDKKYFCYFPYKYHGEEYYINIYDIEKKGIWIRKLWYWYPAQIFRFGPSQLIDIIATPYYILKAISEFKHSFG